MLPIRVSDSCCEVRPHVVQKENKWLVYRIIFSEGIFAIEQTMIFFQTWQMHKTLAEILRRSLENVMTSPRVT